MLFGRDNLATGTTRGVQLVQVASGGSVCSSCTSYDSSSYSSELEVSLLLRISYLFIHVCDIFFIIYLKL